MKNVFKLFIKLYQMYRIRRFVLFFLFSSEKKQRKTPTVLS